MVYYFKEVSYLQSHCRSARVKGPAYICEKHKRVVMKTGEFILVTDPFNCHFKQVGTELIAKTNADIIRSFAGECDNRYGFDNSDGEIVAIWRVKWKRYKDNHTLKICE